jgi:hypothetical protein
MRIPGFSAESALYRSKVHYRARYEKPTAPADAGMCTVTAIGSQLITTFLTRVGELTVAGEGRADRQGPGKHLVLNIRRDGDTVLHFESSIAAPGILSQTWNYGPMVKGVRKAQLVTRDGKRIEGAIDGRRLAPFTNEARSFTFADGSPVRQPIFPPSVGRVLQQVPTAIRNALATRHSTPRLEEAYSRGTAPGRSLGNAIITPATSGASTYGSPPRFDDPESSSSCTDCILEAYAASALCGIACGASLGFACACVAAVPLAFANCHSPGTGVGQGCCPVGCGPSQDMLGVGVVYQCCSGGDSCLNSTTGTCCQSGLQPCNGTTCCPSNAPCRDLGICCPTSQATCSTANGPACCSEGEDCIQNVGCCPAGDVCGNNCCNPFTQTCVNGTCSNCKAPGGILCGNQCCDADTQQCIDNACCPMAQACGGTCCPDGTICNTSGQCVVPQSCPPGEQLCISADKTTQICCPGDSACCDDGSCCGGSASLYTNSSCCGTPSECCSPPG